MKTFPLFTHTFGAICRVSERGLALVYKKSAACLNTSGPARTAPGPRCVDGTAEPVTPPESKDSGVGEGEEKSHPMTKTQSTLKG